MPRPRSLTVMSVMVLPLLLEHQVCDMQHPGGRGHYGLAGAPLFSDADVRFRDVRAWWRSEYAPKHTLSEPIASAYPLSWLCARGVLHSQSS